MRTFALPIEVAELLAGSFDIVIVLEGSSIRLAVNGVEVATEKIGVLTGPISLLLDRPLGVDPDCILQYSLRVLNAHGHEVETE